MSAANRARHQAQEASPGPGRLEISASGLRLPPAMREAVGRFAAVCPPSGEPSPESALAAEIVRDLAVLAHVAASARPVAATMEAIGCVAEIAVALEQAYAQRLARCAGQRR